MNKTLKLTVVTAVLSGVGSQLPWILFVIS